MPINKKSTKKVLSNKKGGKVQKTLGEKFLGHFFSLPMRPTWIATLIFIIYTLSKPRVNVELDFAVFLIIFGMAITITGLIAIRTNQYPGWFSMYTGAAATMFGWLALIIGIVTLI